MLRVFDIFMVPYLLLIAINFQSIFFIVPLHSLENSRLIFRQALKLLQIIAFSVRSPFWFHSLLFYVCEPPPSIHSFRTLRLITLTSRALLQHFISSLLSVLKGHVSEINKTIGAKMSLGMHGQPASFKGCILHNGIKYSEVKTIKY